MTDSYRSFSEKIFVISYILYVRVVRPGILYVRTDTVPGTVLFGQFLTLSTWLLVRLCTEVKNNSFWYGGGDEGDVCIF